MPSSFCNMFKSMAESRTAPVNILPLFRLILGHRYLEHHDQTANTNHRLNPAPTLKTHE